jgi:hypothetical protein
MDASPFSHWVANSVDHDSGYATEAAKVSGKRLADLPAKIFSQLWLAARASQHRLNQATQQPFGLR